MFLLSIKFILCSGKLKAVNFTSQSKQIINNVMAQSTLQFIEATKNRFCTYTDCLLWRFGILTRHALYDPFTYTNGLYGRKSFMPPTRFTAGLLLFSERNDCDVINLRSCVNFHLLSRQRNYGTLCLLLDKVFGFSVKQVNGSILKLMIRF